MLKKRTYRVDKSCGASGRTHFHGRRDRCKDMQERCSGHQGYQRAGLNEGEPGFGGGHETLRYTGVDAEDHRGFPKRPSRFRGETSDQF